MANFLSKLFSRKSYDVHEPQVDSVGNIFYPRDFIAGSRPRTDYDMHRAIDREQAAAICTPLAAVLSKLGDMLSRAEVYVTDEKGNERPRFNDVRALLQHPNPLQSFQAFISQVEQSLRLHGFAPIKLVRSNARALPLAMWNIPPHLFHMRGTGRIWQQRKASDVISRAFVYWNGKEVDLQPHEYIVISSGEMIPPRDTSTDFIFTTPAASLSTVVNTWLAAQAASFTLLVNGGPKGILYSEASDQYGTPAVTKDTEEEIRTEFKTKYGLVGKRFPILVTRYRLGWQPIDFNAAQLRIDENDTRQTAKICNTLGVNPNLFTDAKYDNQESAKKAAYQDVVIPDSLRIAQALTDGICSDGAKVVFDYSAVECLQEDKNKEATTLQNMASALTSLVNARMITTEEARLRLADYIEIDPLRMQGELNDTQTDEEEHT